MMQPVKLSSQKINTKKDILETTQTIAGVALLVETGKLVRR
jgi:hypothetical protein